MSAANFCTMRDFPLFAKDYYEDAKRCPECGAILSADDTECEFCECNELEDYQYYDECARPTTSARRSRTNCWTSIVACCSMKLSSKADTILVSNSMWKSITI